MAAIQPETDQATLSLPPRGRDPSVSLFFFVCCVWCQYYFPFLSFFFRLFILQGQRLSHEATFSRPKSLLLVILLPPQSVYRVKVPIPQRIPHKKVHPIIALVSVNRQLSSSPLRSKAQRKLLLVTCLMIVLLFIEFFYVVIGTVSVLRRKSRFFVEILVFECQNLSIFWFFKMKI